MLGAQVCCTIMALVYRVVIDQNFECNYCRYYQPLATSQKEIGQDIIIQIMPETYLVLFQHLPDNAGAYNAYVAIDLLPSIGNVSNI